ncbi:cobalt-precorrin-5B (C(1))-methyltransferase [Hahella sp. CCB-MM4]|uniref:cobalt-precorrin-5B (C(1))-methyltransferase n=1 Tax=Hahella sp. (strain CCB-MM4) TaxID=1926491 RepID=UPI000B9BC591|nr:cobalt-precorrin-5B (C(1))-methyltransferase [Hahella sp. CCB-MM4]OZG72700.1 cobalt-precorrin-5B (C(1))-methyltransferase [Hahella sp. CCB-MM4]
MWPESSEQPKRLRTGLTTGTCATACCVAAVQSLLAPKGIEEKTKSQQENNAELKSPLVTVKLPRGKLVKLKIVERVRLDDGRVKATTVKDAGDDPDVTHGARVFVILGLSPTPGIRFKAGQGVGTVTRDGLSLGIGEPAINPVPRQMIRDHLDQSAEEFGYQGGFEVEVGVETGQELALKTMNPRLGILGGLSILGTTGIVRPFSCAAYIASIHQGIDVARANGIDHIAATTGSSSEAAIRAHYQLSDMALIEMGDFVGAVLKYLKKVKIAKVSLCGGFGKITKLANGHLDLHSKASSIDFQQMADMAKALGGNAELINGIQNANTSIEVLKLCQENAIPLADAVCEAALKRARAIVPKDIELEVWTIDRQGNFVGSAGQAFHD